MNTLLNLLSAAAVVASGTLAVTPPAPQATQVPHVQVQPVHRPLATAPGLVSAAKAQGPWLTLDDQGLATELDEQPMESSQRWIF